MTSLPVRDAATVLALREGPGEVEVFMVKRNSRMGFLGGMHVFPGGAVDEADRAGDIADLVCGCGPACGLSEKVGLAEAEARGFLVAAIRELFEEAGVLLARDEAGAWVDLEDGSERAARLHQARGPVAAGEASFCELMRAEGLRLATDCLADFAWWITPEREKKRFNTRFFLAPMPGGQQARHDRGESVEGGWLSPSDALARYRRRDIELVPPTIAALRRLEGAATLAEAVERASREEISAILPKISLEGELIAILYPGDDDYHCGQAGPVEPGRKLHRLVMREGLWEEP
jgi:8-oxo-dGTP pyrophosphatase MutT (NUDIX family)